MKINKQLNKTIRETMFLMKFSESETQEGVFWHPYFGPSYKFDMTSSGNDVWSIMTNVFRSAREYSKPQMSDEEKLINMEVALALSGAHTDTQTLDLIISMYELVIEKGVETRLSDIHEVKNRVLAKYKEEEGK